MPLEMSFLFPLCLFRSSLENPSDGNVSFCLLFFWLFEFQMEHDKGKLHFWTLTPALNWMWSLNISLFDCIQREVCQRHLITLWLQGYPLLIKKSFLKKFWGGKRGEERHIVPVDKDRGSIFINLHSQDNCSNLVKGPFLWTYIPESFYSPALQQTGEQVNCVSSMSCFRCSREKFFRSMREGTTYLKEKNRKKRRKGKNERVTCGARLCFRRFSFSKFSKPSF